MFDSVDDDQSGYIDAAELRKCSLIRVSAMLIIPPQENALVIGDDDGTRAYLRKSILPIGDC